MDEWHSLDDDCKANCPDAWLKFRGYRDELRAEGMPWAEAKVILAGFIWDESEEAP